MAQSLEPVSDSVSPSLCPSPVHALSLSVPKINKLKKKINLDTYGNGSVKPDCWEFVIQSRGAWTGILLVGMEWKDEILK